MAPMRISYIGDATTAAGLRLIGARTFSPHLQAQRLWRQLLEARVDCDLLIIDQIHARAIETKLNTLLLTRPIPPVLILPSLEQQEAPEFKTMRAALSTLGLSRIPLTEKAKP